jgi:cation diffusion facilitator CzcD-associated flavoprotein CzcO
VRDGARKLKGALKAVMLMQQSAAVHTTTGTGEAARQLAGTTAQVVIVGSGFAGISMGVRLRRCGLRDFVILEQASTLGGTWRDNDYPGCACDVPSHLYSFSFEPNAQWSRSFATQGEILAYLHEVARKHQVVEHLRFGCSVVQARWDDRAGVWRLVLNNGVTLNARVLIAATGALSQPAETTIRGLEDFRGPVFHTARWSHSVELENKRVAIIGTGASAVQVVPAIAPKVKQLYVLQRTAPWVLPKGDRQLSFFERSLFKRFPFAQKLLRLWLFWRFETRAYAFVHRPSLMRLPRLAALHHLRKKVRDPALRRKLTPDYALGCKRVLLSDDYYPAIQRDNVEVITDPIREIRAHAFATNSGLEYPVDAIILATGFQVGDFAGPPFPIYGPGGISLAEQWRLGPEAYVGTSISGFSNLFFIVGPNSLLGHSSMVDVIEAQTGYIARALETMSSHGLATVMVKSSVHDAFNRWVQLRMQGTIWSKGGCQNRYQTRLGKHVAVWPGFVTDLQRRLQRFDLENYDVTVHTASGEERGEPLRPVHRARR